jgi:TrmH family RNA methyltransferase
MSKQTDCAVCGASIQGFDLECPECGETGYPALRPRKGEGFKGSPEFELKQATDGPTALGRIVFVLHETQDLVNIALVVRAMKNMELTRLHLVRPVEFDAFRIDGIAHDTGDLVERIQIFDDFDEAVAGCVRIAAATARRRTSRQEWSTPADGATALLERTVEGDVAIVFGREDFGLPNEIIDKADEAICIPTNPNHPSLNLGHAALLIAYELRQAALRLGGLGERDLSGKPRDQGPPATADQMEEFFQIWQEAMHSIGMFRNVSPTMKMRSYRRAFKRADLDETELRLFEATAYRVVHYARRMKARLEKQIREG